MKGRTVILLAVLVATPLIGSPVSTALRPVRPEDPVFDFESPYFAPTGPQLPFATQWGPSHSEGALRNILQRHHDAGLRWSFVSVPWSEIEPTPDGYQFHELDKFFSAAHHVGMFVLVQVQVGDWSLPQAWAGPTRTNSMHPGPNAPPVDFAPVVDLWTDLVQRYMPGGDLAHERGWGDRYGVRLWEVDNEPDSIAWWANWAKVPKDFAQYLSLIEPAVHAVDPLAVLGAPSLSEQDDALTNQLQGGAPSGVFWLDQMLSAQESEWESDTYRASLIHPAGGPFIQAYSWHRDNVPVHNDALAARAAQVREVVERHRHDVQYPTRRDAQYWYTEGHPLSYESNATKLARASAQMTAQLLATGATRISLDPGAQQNDQDWPSNPEFLAIRAVTTYFPRAGNTVRADADVTTDGVTVYKQTHPRTGRATYMLWADDLLPGQGPTAAFNVTVPIGTSMADVVGPDWTTTVRSAVAGGIQVTVWADDPSPVIIIAERA